MGLRQMIIKQISTRTPPQDGHQAPNHQQAQIGKQVALTSERRIDASEVCAQDAGQVPAENSIAAGHAFSASAGAGRHGGRLLVVHRPHRTLDALHRLRKLLQLDDDLQRQALSLILSI